MKLFAKLSMAVGVACLFFAGWGLYTAYAAPTPNVLGGGVLISEFVADPTGTPGIDTNLDSTINQDDEYVKLYNDSAGAIDITDWVLTDCDGASTEFVFPSTTVIQPGGYVTILVRGGDPTALNATMDADSFAIATTNPIFLDDTNGDNIALWDSNNNEYIELGYGNAVSTDPPTDADCSTIPNNATLVGAYEGLPLTPNGQSYARIPVNDTNWVLSTASPTAVTFSGVEVSSQNMLFSVVLLLVGVLAMTTAVVIRYNQKA